MQLTELSKISEIKKQIRHLVETGCSDAETAAVIDSHSNRIEELHRLINAMPLDDALEASQKLYGGLEAVLDRFERLASIRVRTAASVSDITRNVRRFIIRSEKIGASIEQLPEAEGMATTIAMYREFDNVVEVFKASRSVTQLLPNSNYRN